jgi:hypothetical protein
VPRPEPATTCAVRAEVWRHPGPGGWHFVTLPAEVADDVRARTGAGPRPFGTVPVVVTLGGTTWATSLFADTASASYLLPLKAAVRRSEEVEAGDDVELVLELLDL